MKTIVVEDELKNLNLLSHFLKKYCPEVDLVASCQTKDEGVELVNQLNPDLLFLDIVLEENTAFELLEEIKHKDVNVIFVTAFDEYHYFDKQSCFRSKPACYTQCVKTHFNQNNFK